MQRRLLQLRQLHQFPLTKRQLTRPPRLVQLVHHHFKQYPHPRRILFENCLLREASENLYQVHCPASFPVKLKATGLTRNITRAPACVKNFRHKKKSSPKTASLFDILVNVFQKVILAKELRKIFVDPIKNSSVSRRSLSRCIFVHGNHTV